MKFQNIIGIFLFMLTVSGNVFSQSSKKDLLIDPALIVSLKECRNISKKLHSEIYPGWRFEKVPVLFYRPNVQEVLINFPYRPKGFSVYNGFNPLGNETIYYRNDTTLFSFDDQNTVSEIDGIPVLVVADPYSSMRNQLRDVVNRPKDWIEKFLTEWNFIPSPYEKLKVILHEAFHVYQYQLAPNKKPNEMLVFRYPFLDPINNSLSVLEGDILRDALLTPDLNLQLDKIKQFVAVRTHRQSLLDSTNVAYENLVEFLEGTAKYIEYKFLRTGEIVNPTKEMYYQQGFIGYKGILFKKFEEVLNNMVKIVAVSDDRFGNKFGAGPLRFKHYDLGACQAVLLDRVLPNWKEKIFQDGVFLTNLLKEALPLSESEQDLYMEKAKKTYNYDRVFEDKLLFEKEGKEKLAQKLASILETKQTLVKVYYGKLTERVGVAFTPFGVSQVATSSTIYDLVPIKIRVKEGIFLEMQGVVPVLIDKENKMIAFAICTTPDDIQPDLSKTLDTKEFSLKGANFDLVRKGNVVEIYLK